jgi:uncharacterized membrane protein YhhN
VRLPSSASAWGVLTIPLTVLAAGAFGWIWLWLRPHVERAMTAPVLAYMVAISVMIIGAGAAGEAGGSGWILIGALGFYLSDLAVARNQFVIDSLVNRIWGLPLYYAAQLTLAWTAGA